MLIRVLRPSDDRSPFHSGDADIDRFLHKYAGQNQFRHHLGATYVAMEDTGEIAGYCTLTVGTLEGEALPQLYRRKLPKYPLPVLRLARLGVDQAFQARGLGTKLLKFVFKLALELSEGYGCAGIVVDAKPDAVSFYERFGFITMETIEGESSERPQPIAMFLSLREVRNATN